MLLGRAPCSGSSVQRGTEPDPSRPRSFLFLFVYPHTYGVAGEPNSRHPFRPRLAAVPLSLALIVVSPSAAAAGAERAAAYLLAEAQRIASVRSNQGKRSAASLAALGEPRVGELGPALRTLVERRIYRVPDAVVRALLALSAGFPAELYEHVPEPRDVLALQARGQRCVSLLGPDTPTRPFADGFEFALHDLCHLDKFANAEHHLGQVGFFASLLALARCDAWIAVESSLDATFENDRDRVGADTNGSSVYLFAVLKMRLKMAARRSLARDAGVTPREGGPLTPAEEARFHALGAELYRCLELRGELARAAHVVSARRDDANAAALLAAEFEARGRAVLAGPRHIG